MCVRTIDYMVRTKESVCHQPLQALQTNCKCGRQTNLANKILWELNDDSSLTLCVFSALSDSRLIWFPHIFSFSGESHVSGTNFDFLPKLYVTSEEEGRAKPSHCSNHREKIAPSASLFLGMDHPPLFSPGGRRLLVQAFILNESKDRERHESERRRMESMNLYRNHNWDTKLCLTCTSWTTEWSLWHRWDFYFSFFLRRGQSGFLWHDRLKKNYISSLDCKNRYVIYCWESW